jgi:hypothetical protein
MPFVFRTRLLRILLLAAVRETSNLVMVMRRTPHP